MTRVARSVLDDQKVGRRKKTKTSFLKKIAWPAVKCSFALLTAGGAYWGLCYTAKVCETAIYRLSLQAARLPSQDWSVRVSGKPSDEKRSIETIATSRLRLGSQVELNKIARDIAATGRFMRVSVSRSGIHRVAINLEPRKPRMQATIRKQAYLISDQCEIYAEDHSGLPSFEGLADLVSSTTLDDTRKLTLTDVEKASCGDLLKLQDNLMEKNILAQKFEYRQHAGYVVILEDGMEVIFGDGPFDDKIAKLRDVMSRSDFISLNPVRVDLDYHGKVFIKSAKAVLL